MTKTFCDRCRIKRCVASGIQRKQRNQRVYPTKHAEINPEAWFRSGERTRPRVPISAPRRNASLVQPKKSLARRQRQHARRVRPPIFQKLV